MIISAVDEMPGSAVARNATLWLMFYLICFGLGYPTLNRYNPAETKGVRDSHEYFQLVVGGPSAAAGHWRYRIFVPYLARPVYLLARGHVGTWNPIAFSMLLVNSVFCASTALLLLHIAQFLGLPLVSGLLAAFAYLANFVVANLQLAGLVDSAECFLMMAVFLVCLQRRWNLLPLLGILGALAKETWCPLALLFVAGWLWHKGSRPWFWTGAMAVAATVVLILLHSSIDGHLVTPLQIAAGERNIHSFSDLLISTRTIFADWTVWITFLWMLPFAAAGKDLLPAQARLGTLLAVGGALALSIWNWAGGVNAIRPIFNVAAPYLCLAFATAVTRLSAGAPVAERATASLGR